MPQRYTATEKWNDPWFCTLSVQDKLFWIYLCDNCNHAGIYKVNWVLIHFYIPNYEFNHAVFNGRIQEVDKETWFLKKFVLFQQGVSSFKELNPSNKCHLSILKILKGKGLISNSQAPKKGLRRGHSNVMYCNSNVKKGIVKGKQFEEIWAKYPSKIGKKEAERHFKATVLTEEDWNAINKAIENYLKSERVEKGYVQNGSTWFNNWQDWIENPEKGDPDALPPSFRKYETKR